MILKMKVKECMCNDVYWVRPETNVYEVAKLMEQHHIGSIPVCDDNQCICGIVTDRDILLRSVICDKNLKTTPISEIMTCNVCTCSENDDVCDAQKKMSEYQIRRIPVVENNKVVGILTIGDLAHFDEELGKQEVCTTIENICNCNGQVKNNY